MKGKKQRRTIRLLQYLKDGWTREEIAEEMGVSLRTIYNWEREARETYGTTTTIGTICKVCMAGKLRDKPKKQEIPKYVKAVEKYLDLIGYGKLDNGEVKQEKPPEKPPEKPKEEFNYKSYEEMLHEFDDYTDDMGGNQGYEISDDKNEHKIPRRQKKESPGE